MNPPAAPGPRRLPLISTGAALACVAALLWLSAVTLVGRDSWTPVHRSQPLRAGRYVHPPFHTRLDRDFEFFLVVERRLPIDTLAGRMGLPGEAGRWLDVPVELDLAWRLDSLGAPVDSGQVGGRGYGAVAENVFRRFLRRPLTRGVAYRLTFQVRRDSRVLDTCQPRVVVTTNIFHYESAFVVHQVLFFLAGAVGLLGAFLGATGLSAGRPGGAGPPAGD